MQSLRAPSLGLRHTQQEDRIINRERANLIEYATPQGNRIKDQVPAGTDIRYLAAGNCDTDCSDVHLGARET